MTLTPSQQAYLNQLKPGDLIRVQTQTGIVTETVKRVTAGLSASTIYTYEGGLYWRDGGHGRFGAKHPRRGDSILIPEREG